MPPNATAPVAAPAVRLNWWEEFEDKQLQRACTAGAFVAERIAADPESRAQCYANFQHALIEFNELWAGISSPIDTYRKHLRRPR